MGCDQSISVPQETRGLIYIYYGTTSGNSSRLAFHFADLARKQSFIPKIINLSEFDPEQMIASKASVFFVSTYGAGSSSNDALKFSQWVFSEERKQNEFQAVNYMVFALGNTKHSTFCQFGIRLDERLEQLGGKRLIAMGKGNAAENTTENDYQDWLGTGVEQVLQTNFPLVKFDPEKFELSTFKLKYTNDPEVDVCDNLDYMAKQYCNSQTYKINEIRELKQKPTLGNSTLFIDLTSDNMQYPTAANIAIYPQNSDKNIEEFCKLLKLDPQQKFQIITTSKSPIPTPISIYNYLKKFCDFLGPVSKKQLSELSNLVGPKEKRDELLHFASHQGREAFEEEFTKKKESLLTVLQKYNIKNLTLDQVLEICPLIAPRFFTIASSNKKFPNNIQLLASQLVIKDTRMGLCSEYFTTLKKGDIVRGFIQESKFKFPQNPKVPILLIGPGAGLAPMRALIQERDYFLENNKFDECPFQGPMELLFGCRTEDEFLLEKELKEFKENGTLTEFQVAFSRKEPKKYVTDLMDLEKLQSLLMTMQGVIYVCGSSQMGRDVSNKIMDMFKKLENVPPYLAYKKANELEQKNQLITEFWG